MKKRFLSIFVIFIGSYNLFAQSNATKEEYAVYAVVLTSLRSENSKNAFSFVILDNTFRPEYFESKTGRFKSLSRDFQRKNLTASKFDRSFPVNYDYELTNQTQIDELLKKGEKEFKVIEAEDKLRNIVITSRSGIVWKPFYARYPKANGYYRFSRIGFSPDKKFALISVEGKGAYWSGNTDYVLRKTKGEWTVYQAGGGFSVE